MTCFLIYVYYKPVKLWTFLLVKKKSSFADPSLLCLVLRKVCIKSRLKLAISISTPVASGSWGSQQYWWFCSSAWHAQKSWELPRAHIPLDHVYGSPFDASIELSLPFSTPLPWMGHFIGNTWEFPKQGEPSYKGAQLHFSFLYKRVSRSWDVEHEGSQDTVLTLGEAVAGCITLPKPWRRRCSPAQLTHLLHLTCSRDVAFTMQYV